MYQMRECRMCSEDVEAVGKSCRKIHRLFCKVKKYYIIAVECIDVTHTPSY